MADRLRAAKTPSLISWVSHKLFPRHAPAAESSGCKQVRAKIGRHAKELARHASWATRYVQPQQLLVGIAMVARGEFAYLVAETAQVV